MINCPQRYFFAEDFLTQNFKQMASSLDPDMPMIIEHLSGDDAYEESMAHVLKAYENA